MEETELMKSFRELAVLYRSTVPKMTITPRDEKDKKAAEIAELILNKSFEEGGNNGRT